MPSIPMSEFSTPNELNRSPVTVPWFDAGFVDGIPVLQHVFDYCIPSNEDVFDTYFKALLISIPVLFPTHQQIVPNVSGGAHL